MFLDLNITNLAGDISVLQFFCISQTCTERETSLTVLLSWHLLIFLLFCRPVYVRTVGSFSVPVVVINYKFLFWTVCVFNVCERVSAFYSTSGAVLRVEKRPRGERSNAGRRGAALSGTASGVRAARTWEDAGVASGSFSPHSHYFGRSLEAWWITCLLRHGEERRKNSWTSPSKLKNSKPAGGSSSSLPH